MKTESIKEFNDQELLQKAKKLKNDKFTNAFIIGITFGIVAYSIFKNGFGFFTFSPFVLAYIIFKNSKNNQILENEIQNELKSRNLI